MVLLGVWNPIALVDGWVGWSKGGAGGWFGWWSKGSPRLAIASGSGATCTWGASSGCGGESGGGPKELARSVARVSLNSC